MKDEKIIDLCRDLDPEIIAAADLEGEGVPLPENLLQPAGQEAIRRARQGAEGGSSHPPKKRLKPGGPEKRGKKGQGDPGTRRRFVFTAFHKGAAAAVLLAAILLSSFFMQGGTGAGAIASPSYPAKTSFNDYRPREDLDPGFMAGLKTFAFNSAALVLQEEEGDGQLNSLYSPISLYLALALVAESAGGPTRDEILAALALPDMALVNRETGKLFRNLYTHNDIGRLTLANSLWLAQDVDFKLPFLERAADAYYAHSYQVNFRSPDAPRLISRWIGEHTGGKLGQIQEFDPDQVLLLLSTVYFYDEWVNRFSPNNTKVGNFYLADGTSVDSDFMAMTLMNSFQREEGYLVSSLQLKNSCSMVFILPDPGLSPYDLIQDPAALALAVTALKKDDAKFGEVTFKVPKFNFSADLDLKPALSALGMEKAFRMEEADFSHLSDFTPIYISGVSQSATIAIDEKGVEAAAFTRIDYAGSAPPDDKAELILNRPFIFAITGAGDVPLFIGVVNNPVKN